MVAALVTALLLALSGSAAAREDAVLTLWPLLDYRHSAAVDYTSLNVAGPLLNFERKGRESEFHLRPLYFRAADASGASYSELLYPVASRKHEPGQSIFQGLHLLEYDYGDREKGSRDEFMLFPFVFSGKKTDRRDGYFALFPLGGRILEKLGRDEIRFTLFPLYAETRRDDTTVTNVLWPVFARVRGEGERGVKFWPFFGRSHKEGVYRKAFYLWPIVFDYDLALDTDAPTRRRAVFPFYVAEDAPQRRSRTVLWPFFSHFEDRGRDYEEWTFPWPLVGVAKGSYKESRKFLPLYADERRRDYRKRWFLWPLYKVERTDSEALLSRRYRVLYFLYSDLEETVPEEVTPRKRRVALWPLFTYEQIRGVSRFHTFSLLEPLLPENEALERNWAPLWRLYQAKWDQHGNGASTLLWNLYWKERRGDDLACELFPLFSYRSEGERDVDLQLLKGLFRYRGDAGGKRIHLFYLPWAFRWGRDVG